MPAIRTNALGVFAQFAICEPVAILGEAQSSHPVIPPLSDGVCAIQKVLGHPGLAPDNDSLVTVAVTGIDQRFSPLGKAPAGKFILDPKDGRTTSDHQEMIVGRIHFCGAADIQGIDGPKIGRISQRHRGTDRIDNTYRIRDTAFLVYLVPFVLGAAEQRIGISDKKQFTLVLRSALR